MPLTIAIRTAPMVWNTDLIYKKGVSLCAERWDEGGEVRLTHDTTAPIAAVVIVRSSWEECNVWYAFV